MSFELGRTIGGYEFVDILKSSRNGVLYRVRNVAKRRFEMLRVLSDKLQEDPVRVERLLREGKILSRMSHPHIVTFYSAETLEGQLVLTTEVLEGSTLAQRAALGPIPWPEAVGYLSQTLSALGYAHAQGIVHREIAPSAILVTPEGSVKLTSFGMAKTPTDPRLTVAGTVLGSLYYMSPEQVKGTAALDGRSDIYSTGVTLYKILTGRVPFDRESQFDVMLAHVADAAVPPSAAHPGVPPEFDAVILKAMAKDPAERFQTAQEFAASLDEIKLTLEGNVAGPARSNGIIPLSAPPPGTPSPIPPLPSSGTPMPVASAVPQWRVHPWRSPQVIAQVMLAAAGLFLVAVFAVLTILNHGHR
ncbi:MAG: serine/threonine-protein kinase [Bryobacteraceae bacterium]